MKKVIVSLALLAIGTPAWSQDAVQPGPLTATAERYRDIELRKLEYALIEFMLTDNLVHASILPVDNTNISQHLNSGDVSDFGTATEASLRSLGNMIESLGGDSTLSEQDTDKVQKEATEDATKILGVTQNNE